MEEKMNMHIAKGSMKELKGELKQTWAKLTDEDIKYLEGNVDEIVGKVQKAYGFTRERAEEEFDRFKNKHANYFRDEREMTTKERGMGTLNRQVDSSLSNIRSRTRDFGDDLSDSSNEYMEKVRDMGSMALNRSTEFIRSYPGYTVLGAASVGFLLGALIARRR
jgi:uncharacterized protein YjbJ (UPF0337 family)